MLKKVYWYLNFKVNFFFNEIRFRRQGIRIKRPFLINGKIFVSNNGSITIDKNFNCNSGINMNPIGGDIIARLICLDGAELIIGKNVKLSNSTILAKKSIVIEDNVMIGGGVRIWDTDFHSLDPLIRGTKGELSKDVGIIIRKNAFIGAGSIVLKGVTIGENSIIAAGSVVTKHIPDNQIWGGNPAVLIRII